MIPHGGQGHGTIRVILVDDHLLILDALTRALQSEPDIAVIGTAASLHELEALGHAPGHQPDVVIMDLGLPDGSGIDGCRLVRARWPGTRIIILSGSDDAADVLAAVEAGADGYLLKANRVRTVIAAVRAAVAGEVLVSPDLLGTIARRLAGRPTKQVLAQPLTPRELTVLRLLSLGHSTRAIASKLELSQGTVRVHVEAIRRKFNVSSRLEAVSAAIQHRIVAVPIA